MKLFKLAYLTSLLGLIFHVNIYCNSIITLFIDQAKEQQIQNPDQGRPTNIVSSKLVQPSFVYGKAVSQSFLKTQGIDGVSALYLGYMAVSDKNGQITFPRKQQSDQMYLFVTPQVIPTFMIAPTTIHHWQLDANQPVAMYEINRKKDKKLNTYYFDVVDVQVAIKDPGADKETVKKYVDILSGKQAIPFNSIALLTHPNNIKVPVGVSLNTYSTNFVLPNLTANKIDTAENSLYTLTIKQYFEQINIASKNDSPNIATIIANQ